MVLDNDHEVLQGSEPAGKKQHPCPAPVATPQKMVSARIGTSLRRG